MSKFSPHISYAQYAKTYEYIYSWNLGIRSFVRGRETWQMPQYVTNVKSADLCQYDVQSTTASRTDFAAVRVFARKSTRNQMKIDSPDDRSTRLHDYTRLPRLLALANRMSTADGQSVPPSLFSLSTLNFALWECLTPFRGNSGTLNLASTIRWRTLVLSWLCAHAAIYGSELPFHSSNP